LLFLDFLIVLFVCLLTDHEMTCVEQDLVKPRLCSTDGHAQSST